MARLLSRLFGWTSAPSAPTIVSVEATSSTSICVKWNASEKDGGSPVTGYVVEYHAASDSDSSFEMQVVRHNVFSMTLHGLIPSTEYNVRVRGENAVGHSVPSATMRTRTEEFGTLQASGYHIPWHLYSEGDGQKWPTFTPSQLSQHGFAGPHVDLLQNSGPRGYPPIYVQNNSQEKLLKTLRETIKGKDVESFHRHLDELERILQNSERIKQLLEEDGVLCYGAYIGSKPVVETLIEKGVDINTMSTVPEHPEYFNVKSSPLHWAADSGNVDTVRCLIEKGANVSSKDDRLGMTPLYLAAGRGNVDIVEYLVGAGGDIHSRDRGGKTPLHQAAAKGHVDILQYLVGAGGDIQSKDHGGVTPLHYAAAEGHVDTQQYLVEAGADFHSKDDDGMTPLHRAAVGGHVDTVQYLIKAGSDIHSKAVDGITPLHSAAIGGDAGTAQVLVEKGADINIKDSNGDTPLVVAAEMEREEVVAYLKRAADSNMLESESTGRMQEQSPEEPAELRTAMKRYTVKANLTGIELGSGTYGRVIELLSAGEIVAGKVFKASSNINQQVLTNKLFGELSLMTQLNHPNIVQCKGVCFLEDETMPVLLMERLMSSLHAYLLQPVNLNIALVRKLSILCDVASGLLYLHCHTPAIIHRDLTGNNVLLDSELRAKISDFGNARLMDLDPETTPGIFTSLPGTLDYMPPEAQGDSAKCGPSLDVFSFGHLSLFTINQSSVHPLLPPTYCDAKGDLHGCSEVKRRKKYLDIAEQHLGLKHSVVVLIKQCLHNDSAQRPSTAELETRLQDILISMKSPSQYTTSTLDKVTRVQVTSGGDIILSEQDLYILTEILRPAAPQWKILGLAFGFLNHELTIIECKPLLIPEGPPGYFREMLGQWLKWAPPNHSPPTVESLALTLQSSGHEDLAVKLRTSFLQRKGRKVQCVVTSPATQSLPPQSPSTAGPADTLALKSCN